jgi:hypothetical protein
MLDSALAATQTSIVVGFPKIPVVEKGGRGLWSTVMVGTSILLDH